MRNYTCGDKRSEILKSSFRLPFEALQRMERSPVESAQPSSKAAIPPGGVEKSHSQMTNSKEERLREYIKRKKIGSLEDRKIGRERRNLIKTKSSH